VTAADFLEEFQDAGVIPRLAEEEIRRLALMIDSPPKKMELALTVTKTSSTNQR
jgi:hypothetical protein